MYVCMTGRGRAHAHYLSACAGSLCVCVCAVACRPSAYQQLHSLRLKRNFNGITTAANTFELTKSSAKASLTLSCDSALSLCLSLFISVSFVLPQSPGLDDNSNSDCVLWSAIAIATRPTGVNSCQLFVDTHTPTHTHTYTHTLKGPMQIKQYFVVHFATASLIKVYPVSSRFVTSRFVFFCFVLIAFSVSFADCRF